MPLSDFQVLFKVNVIFKDFQDSPVYSSTFQACANPVRLYGCVGWFAPLSLACNKIRFPGRGPYMV